MLSSMAKKKKKKKKKQKKNHTQTKKNTPTPHIKKEIEQNTSAEMGTGLGAGSCVTLGRLLPFFGQGSQALSCSCVISARELKFWHYFWLLCLAVNTH